MTAVLEQEIQRVLLRYVSSLNARVMLDRARRSVGAQQSLSRGDAPRAVAALMGSARLFVAAADLGKLEAELAGLGAPPEVSRQSFTIASEHDVRRSRLAARDLAAQLGARPMLQQKIATAVSELARNIVAYTPGGRIDLTPEKGPPPSLLVLAEDRGPGITNLEAIFAGRYRSRTGLGRGLIAVKQLMDRFEIATGPDGTRVEAEARL